MVGQANNMFWLLMNELQDGGVDLGGVYGRWCGWYGGFNPRMVSLSKSSVIKNGHR